MHAPLRSAFLLALLGGAVSAHAVTLFDDFSTSQTGVTRTTVGSSTSVAASLGGGLSRTLVLTQITNTLPGTAESSAFVSNGAYNFSNGPQVTSNYAIDYRYSAPADFTGLGSFAVDFRNNDLPYTLFIDVEDTSGAVSTFTGQVRSGASTVFASRVSNAANLSRVARISVQSDGTLAGTDSTITGVRSIQAVPEPATMAALGLGAAALLRRRKRA